MTVPGWQAQIHEKIRNCTNLRLALRLTCCMLLVLAGAAIIIALGHANYQINMIWIANGTLLAYLLVTPRRRWIYYCIASAIGLTLASALLGEHDPLPFTIANIAEVLIGAFAVRRRSQDLPDFSDVRYLWRFSLFAVVLGPLLSALAVEAYCIFFHLPREIHHLLNWVLADGLGIAVITPAMVSVLRTHLRLHMRLTWSWLLHVLLILATIGAFAQSDTPLIFVIYPLLMLVLLQLGLTGAMLGLLAVSLISAVLTSQGHGPLAAWQMQTHVDARLLLQIFVATGMFILYSVSVVLERQRNTERQLRHIAYLHHTVSENSRDLIILADFNGHRNYVSNASYAIGGWTPEQLRRQDSLELIHPDDLPRVVEILHQMRAGMNDALIELRIRKTDGNYLWVESSLRLVRDPETHQPTGLLNMVRDISGRKQAEQQLQDAYRAVEAMAVLDALTGVANRRRFDQVLSAEWRRALRDHLPLSLLLIDVDHFKAYNDHYGHVRGDSCLKQIAESALDVVTRASDLVARFGGEEFAIILPNTDNEGALRVADDICQNLLARRLPHPENEALPFVSISVGCATLIPAFGTHSVQLIEQADAALYLAKRSGRNQVANANSLSDDDPILREREMRRIRP